MIPRNRVCPEPDESARSRPRSVFRVIEATAVLDAQDASDEDEVDLSWKAENAVLQHQNTLLVDENRVLKAEIHELKIDRKNEVDDRVFKKETESNETVCLRLQVELMQSRVALQNSEFDDLRSRYEVLASRNAATTSHIAVIKRENINLVRQNGLSEEQCRHYRAKIRLLEHVLRDRSAQSIRDTLEIDRLKREYLVQSEVVGTLDARLRDRVGELSALLQEHVCEVGVLNSQLEARAAENIQLQSQLAESDAKCAAHVENWKSLHDIMLCPVSHELISDPVVLSNGMCFDRLNIVAWFEACGRKRQHPTCPVRREQVFDFTIRDAFMLKQISSFITEKADQMGISEHMS